MGWGKGIRSLLGLTSSSEAGSGSASNDDYAARLRTRLQTYPPYDAPHVGGSGKQISRDQARANLGYFETVRPRRLELIQSLLREDAGIDAQPALASPASAGAGLADELAAWAASRWPGLHELRLATIDAWLNSHRAGADIMLSVVMDVAILLGELIVRGNPDWRWDIDLDPLSLRRDMVSSHRVALLADPVGEHRRPFVIDTEDIVVGRFQHPNNIQYMQDNPWRVAVTEGIEGADMAFWRHQISGD